MTFIGITLGAVVGLLLGGAYYAAVPAAATGTAPTRPAALQVVVELLRSAAVAALVAGLLDVAELSGPVSGALLGLALWTLPLVLLVGSVFHEGTPVRAATLHAGDWLLKLPALGAVVGALS